MGISLGATAPPQVSRAREALRSIKRWVTPLEKVNDNQLMDRIFLANMSVGSNCVDIGASRGRFLRVFATRAPKGIHHAFEPIPASAERLVRLFPSVSVHNMALSDEIGETEFHMVPENLGLSSIQYRSKRYEDHKVDKIKVQLGTLDSVIGEQHVDIIKLDVEGAQFKVLSGARGVLKRCKPLVLFEHGRMAEQDYGATSDMIFDVFNDCGLSLQTLEGYLRKQAPLTREGFEKEVGTPPRDNYVGYVS